MERTKIAIAVADENPLFIKAVIDEFKDSNLISVSHVASTIAELIEMISLSEIIPNYVVMEYNFNFSNETNLKLIFESEKLSNTKIIFSEFLLNRNSKRSYHDFDVPGTWIDSMEKKNNESILVMDSRYYTFSHDKILRTDANDEPIIMTNTEHLILSYTLNSFKKENISKLLGLSIEEIDMHLENVLAKL